MSRCHLWPGHASCGPCPPLCVLMSESDADVRCPGSNCALAACTGDTEPGSHSPLAPAARAVTRTVGDPQMSQPSTGQSIKASKSIGCQSPSPVVGSRTQARLNQAGTICGTFVQHKSGLKIFVLFVFTFRDKL